MKLKSVVSIACWTACNVFLVSSVIAGCSGADNEPAPTGNAEQGSEDSQEAPCAPPDESAMDLGSASVTLDPTDPQKGNLTLASCVCCGTLRSRAKQYCADHGRPLAYAYCGGVCGLCGCDNAYSYVDFGCA
jgi:hypothetical protein